MSAQAHKCMSARVHEETTFHKLNMSKLFQVLVKHLGLTNEGTLKFPNFGQKSLVCDKQVIH